MGDLKLAEPRFRIRDAKKEDAPAMTEVFFRSFNALFWQYFMPDTAVLRQWWTDGWQAGVLSSTDQSFVVEDTEKDNKIVAFSRWMKPQSDGSQERECWPDLPPNMDLEVATAFFGGMEANRHEMMGKRPHWFLEMLGVHEDYQKFGIGASLIKWGTDQADSDGLETYLDASEKGKPYYKKRHAFGRDTPIKIPDRPEYGSFIYVSLVREPQKH
ncbi:hypothetical protein LTR97_003305 [Elasticomyces elasticus]|uniref:N-acetyltransferase domain-containing protein n=1 Tax=Elasticomyces elasticus TaxID=574655 RepID=A0AAN7WGK7_9PEZI|nr:hypothetical protein LTR97_003305 [Elasticomyces elasticus]